MRLLTVSHVLVMIGCHSTWELYPCESLFKISFNIGIFALQNIFVSWTWLGIEIEFRGLAGMLTGIWFINSIKLTFLYVMPWKMQALLRQLNVNDRIDNWKLDDIQHTSLRNRSIIMRTINLITQSLGILKIGKFWEFEKNANVTKVIFWEYWLRIFSNKNVENPFMIY